MKKEDGGSWNEFLNNIFGIIPKEFGEEHIIVRQKTKGA
jgi:hypothetical protein